MMFHHVTLLVRILNNLPQLPYWLSTSLMSEDKEDQKPMD